MSHTRGLIKGIGTNVLLGIFLSLISFQPVFAIDKNFFANNNIIIYDPNATTCGTGTSGTSGATLNGNDNLEKIYNYMLGKGLSDAQAAGVVGNISQESGGYPQRKQGTPASQLFPDPSGISSGWGIIQWTPGSKVLGIAKQAGITGSIGELSTQLDIVWWHMTNTTPTGAQNFISQYKTVTDVTSATQLYEQKMEAAGDPQMQNRIAAAKLALKYSKNPSAISGLQTDGSTGCACPTTNSVSTDVKAVGNIPINGSDVGATIYGGAYTSNGWKPSNSQQGNQVGGKVDDNGMGNDGISLAGKTAYAELDMGSALGKLPEYTKLKITYNGKSIVAEKRDIGAGGSPINGKPRAIDLWWETAQLLDMKDSSVVHVDPVPDGTPLTPLTSTPSTPGQTGSCTDGAAAGNAVQTAINYAWPDYRGRGYVTLKPSYAKAVEAAQKAGKYVGGNNMPGVDCGGFITRVMQDSGVDPTYGGGGPTGTQLNYDETSGKYIEIHPTSTADMKPGDIAVQSNSSIGHTYMYVGDNPGFGSKIASASLDDRAPMAGHETPADPAYHWFRLK